MSATATKAPLAPDTARDDEHAPRRWAGKYARPELLESSYLEAQKELGRRGNRIGELEREKAELLAELDVWRATYPVTATLAERVRHGLKRRNDA